MKINKNIRRNLLLTFPLLLTIILRLVPSMKRLMKIIHSYISTMQQTK